MIMLESADLLAEALRLLTASLTILDRVQAPQDIGAYVDFAMERVRQTLKSIQS